MIGGPESSRLRYDDGRFEVVGLHDQLLAAPLPAGTHVRGVRLRPEAVGPAFRSSADALRNVTASADLRGDDGIDRWLRSIEPDARTTAAVRLLGTRALPDVAAERGMSDRHLHRVLLGEVGLAPKAYRRILRLRRFLAASERGRRIADAVAVAGYADQAHLNRDTRALTAHTPARLLEMRCRRAGLLDPRWSLVVPQRAFGSP